MTMTVFVNPYDADVKVIVVGKRRVYCNCSENGFWTTTHLPLIQRDPTEREIADWFRLWSGD